MSHQDTYFGRIAQLRQRFRRQPESLSWATAPRMAVRFLVMAVRKAHADELGQQSAALAFITLMSLVPLLSALSFLGARAFAEQDAQQRILDLLGQLLPFTEAKLVETLTSFLDNASTVSGFSFVIFITTVIAAFMSIEETVNRIWNIPRQRPFRERLLSFTLLLFWGPILIGATYSVLFFLRQQNLLQRFGGSLPAQALPFFVTLLGLTMLYWLVPNTEVHFRSALGGGFMAALLLEGLRQGFGLYRDHATSVSVIYTSLGLVFFFVISVQLWWWLTLLGSEMAFCIQHHAMLLRERRHAATPEGSWLGLVVLVVLAERVRTRVPITPREELAEQLQLPMSELLGVLEPLLSAGLVRETGGSDEGFLLACESHRLRLTEVFELYERDHWVILEPLAGTMAGKLEEFRVELTDARDRQVAAMVLADLLEPPEIPVADEDTAIGPVNAEPVDEAVD